MPGHNNGSQKFKSSLGKRLCAKESEGSCGDENTPGGLTELWTVWRNTREKSF